jgi:hypothetical protein
VDKLSRVERSMLEGGVRGGKANPIGILLCILRLRRRAG